MESPYAVKILTGPRSGTSVGIPSLLTIGRDINNALRFHGLEGSLVSRFHTEIGYDNGRLSIRDKNSTNGTWVNGMRIASGLLNPGDIISLGSNGPKLQVVQTGPPPADAGNPPAASFEGDCGLNLARRTDAGNVDETEMGRLPKDEPRIGRTAQEKMPGSGDMGMIHSAAGALKKSRFRLMAGIFIVSAAGLAIVLVPGIQSLSYRIRLSEQKSLLSSITALNTKLEQKQGADGGDGRLELLARIRAQERILSRLRQKIAPEDLTRLYHDSLGIEIHQVMESFGEDNYIVPDIFIRQVRKYIETWKQTPGFIRNAFRNKGLHGPLILRELDSAGMPRAFLYLAVHESGLDSAVVSRSGARGLWQFMPETGRDFGLSVPENWQELSPDSDERTLPLKSTRAAIRYLKVLAGQFGSVPLAMAAYNAGEGRITRALRNIEDPINNRDFWYIYRSGILAEETNEYVPKIVATMVLDRFGGEYGF